MSARSLRAVSLVGAALLLGLSIACSTASSSSGDDETAWVVTQQPSGTFDPAARYAAGTRIVAVGTGPVGGRWIRSLTQGFASAADPSLSADGRSLLFAGRQSPDEPWSIYERRLDGGRPWLRARLERDCFQPRHIPGDGVVFACDDGALYKADDAGVERLTHGPGAASHPVMLRDGRILFSMAQAAGHGRGTEGAVALFTLNTDGTMLEPFSGSHRTPRLKLDARPDFADGVVYRTGDTAGATGVERVMLSDPQGAPERPAWLDPAGRPEIASVDPLPGGESVVAARTGTDGYGLFLADGGALRPLYDDPEWDEVQVVAAIERPAPKGRPSARHRDRPFGTLLCYDTGRSDGEIGPGRAAPSPARLRVEALVEGAAVELGVAPVHDDGSVLLEVPADVPIRVRSLDGAREELAVSDWFWLRPGETRACFGCHEDRNAAPRNRPVAALGHPAERLGVLNAEVRP